MMQKKNRPITIDINTNQQPVSLDVLLYSLAVRFSPPVPISGKLRFVVSSTGQVSVINKGLS